MTTAKDPNANMNAIELLKSQHRTVEGLFSELLATSDHEAKLRTQLFGELALQIEGHAQIEEKALYPLGKDVDKDLTLEAYEEHAAVRHLIAQIAATDPTDETYKAKVTVLKEMIEHHVKEEEKEYFPELKKALGTPELVELGAEMAEQFSEFMEHPTKGPKTAKAAQAQATLSGGRGSSS